MRIFIKYIVNIIISLLKRAWYHIEMAELKKELKKEKKEVSDAKDESDRLVDDFESEYKLFLEQLDENGVQVDRIESDELPGSRADKLRDSAGKVRKSGDGSEKDD